MSTQPPDGPCLPEPTPEAPALVREAVRTWWYAFSAAIEGDINHLYLDIRGIVTISLGVVVTLDQALALPFRYDQSDEPATPEDIEREWRFIEGQKQLAQEGASAAGRLTTLYLPDIALAQLVEKRMGQMVPDIVKRFPAYPAWCASAQTGTLSVAWACGTGFEDGPHGFHKLASALRAEDFATAALESHMDETHNRGLSRRNPVTRALFLAAAAWVEAGRPEEDADVLDLSLLPRLDHPTVVGHNG